MNKKDYCTMCGVSLKASVAAMFGAPNQEKPVEYKEGWYCHECHEAKRKTVKDGGIFGQIRKTQNNQ